MEWIEELLALGYTLQIRARSLSLSSFLQCYLLIVTPVYFTRSAYFTEICSMDN